MASTGIYVSGFQPSGFDVFANLGLPSPTGKKRPSGTPSGLVLQLEVLFR
jgi:hypothetical protein